MPSGWLNKGYNLALSRSGFPAGGRLGGTERAVRKRPIKNEMRKGVNMNSAIDRYRTDLVFRQIVDLFQMHLGSPEWKDVTPSDLRAAALLAASMYEERNIRPIVIRSGDELSRYEPEIWSRDKPGKRDA